MRSLITVLALSCAGCLCVTRSAGAQESAPSDWKVQALAGLGYGSFSEQRPDGSRLTNPSKLEASGLTLQLHGGIARKLSTRFALGAALSYIDMLSPSMTVTLRGPGTAVFETTSLSGGYFGLSASYLLSDAFDLEAVVGYGGIGRSSPNPSMGGWGPALSGAATWFVARLGSARLTLQGRFTVIPMSANASNGETGTYTSILILPALLGGISWM
jgi:hypothetical protein